MANKDPAFLFYPADFIVGCSDLTMEERGQYITLLCLQHQKGRLSKRTIDLQISNVSTYVLDKFDQDEDGNYYNTRLEEEIAKRENYAKSRYENGCKGGRPKKTIEKPYGFENETICQTIAKPTQNHSENENINENINKSINDNKDNNIYYIDLFNELWKRYPKKENKKTAIHNFLIIKPDKALYDKMKNAIEKARRWKRWNDPRYIPHFSTWLLREQWNDEIPESELSSFDLNDWAEEKGISW